MRGHENPDGELTTEILIDVLTRDQMTDIFNKVLPGVIFLKHWGRSPGERRKASTEVTEDKVENRKRLNIICTSRK